MTNGETDSGRSAGSTQIPEILRFTPDAVYLVDPSTDRIVDANAAACRVLGYELEDLLATPMSAIHPSELDRLKAFAREVFTTGHGWTDQLTCTTSAGVVIPAEITATVSRVGGKELMLAVVRDLTREKRAELERSTILEIGRLVGSTLDFDKIFDDFVAQLRRLLPFDRLVISTVDDSRELVRIDYVHGLRVADREPGDRREMAMTPFADVIQQQKPMLFDAPGGLELAVEHPALAIGSELGLRSAISVPLISADQSIGVLTLRSLAANPYAPEDVGLLQQIGDQIASAIVNARLFQETRQVANEREIVAEIGKVISSSPEIGTVYERFATLVSQLVPIDRLIIAELNLDEDDVVPVYISGIGMPGPEVGHHRSLSSTPFDSVARTGVPFLLDGPGFDRVVERYPDEIHGQIAGLRSMMGVPLVSRGEIIGILIMRSKLEHAYGERELEVATRVADQISGAISNAKLFGQAQELAVVNERNRLAREIHDSLAQGITGLIWQLNSTMQMVTQDSDAVRESIEEVRDQARDLLSEVRRAVWDLRSNELEGKSLSNAIQDETAKVARASGISVNFETKGDEVALQPGIESTVLRVIQEALINAARHSSASSVQVTLTYMADAIRVVVSDDGKGFDTATVANTPASRSGGFGIVGMSERAHLVGGELTVESAPGAGTTVTAVLPFSSRRSDG